MVLLGISVDLLFLKKIVCFSCSFISGQHYYNTVSVVCDCSFIMEFLFFVCPTCEKKRKRKKYIVSTIQHAVSHVHVHDPKSRKYSHQSQPLPLFIP